MKPKPPIQVIVLDEDGKELVNFYPSERNDQEIVDIIRSQEKAELSPNAPEWVAVS